MPIQRTETQRRRRAFLHALGSGRSVVEAADHAGIRWSTLYAWRQDAPAFRAAWDRATVRARDALADRLRAALIERAVVGIDEPVFHAGQRVGSRKRYSDLLLLAGLREMTAPAAAAVATPPRPVVIIRDFGQELEEEERKAAPASAEHMLAAPAAPGPIPSEATPLPPARPVPAEPQPRGAHPERALCWAHPGRRDDI